MPRAEAIQRSRNKVDEAAFFLAKMQEVEVSSHRNLTDAQLNFGYFLSAFLSSARSTTQILSEEVGWAPIDAFRDSWPVAEQTLERALKDARDLAVHVGHGVANSTIEYVPESKLSREPRHPLDGYVFISRPPGVSEIRIGVRAFTIQTNGRNEPAVACCRVYLGLITRIVGHFDTNS